MALQLEQAQSINGNFEVQAQSTKLQVLNPRIRYFADLRLSAADYLMNKTLKQIGLTTLVAGIFWCASLSVANARGRVETIQFQSKLINATLPYSVVLPTDYDASRTSRYPVLYLLHGLTGHYNDWLSRTNLADYAEQYRLIVVTPEGNDSWYIDSVTAPSEKYESYILKELIPDVQQRYRTIEARYGRAIAGLSMGGYGSIKFGLKSPSTFVFAGSMSGALGVTRFTEKDVGSAGWQTSLKLFGLVGSDTRKQNDLFELIKQIPANRVGALPFFYFDCGTEDSPLVFPYNGELAALMAEKKIAHEYRQMPGDHSWGYWDRQVQEVLKIAVKILGVRRPGALSPRVRKTGHSGDPDAPGHPKELRPTIA